MGETINFSGFLRGNLFRSQHFSQDSGPAATVCRGCRRAISCSGCHNFGLLRGEILRRVHDKCFKLRFSPLPFLVLFMRRSISLSRRAFCACLACGLAAPRAMAAEPPVPPAGPAAGGVDVGVDVRGTLEPRLNVARGGDHAAPHVALTLDACSGHVDMRILSVLMDEEIPATIFVTARWLRKNAEALAFLMSRPDLFEIENHGLNHVPAIDRPGTVYGIQTAGSMEAVVSEVENGAKWMVKDGLAAPRWFRGATALYTPASIAAIEALGYRIAGFSLNGDKGASLPAGAVARRIAAARDGDVVIAHVNHPERDSGAGVARGVLALKARGAVFVRLDSLEGRDVAGVAQP